MIPVFNAFIYAARYEQPYPVKVYFYRLSWDVRVRDTRGKRRKGTASKLCTSDTSLQWNHRLTKRRTVNYSKRFTSANRWLSTKGKHHQVIMKPTFSTSYRAAWIKVVSYTETHNTTRYSHNNTYVADGLHGNYNQYNYLRIRMPQMLKSHNNVLIVLVSDILH